VAAKSALLLFLGDPTTDRRVQNFQRLFTEAGWNVELLAPPTKKARGPGRFYEHSRNLKRILRSKQCNLVIACDLYSLAAAAWMKRRGNAQILVYDAREVYTELPTVANKPLYKTIWKGVERRGLGVTDIVTVTGPRDVPAIFNVHRFLSRTVLIRNLPWRDSSLQRDRGLLQKFGIEASSRVLIYVGGLQAGRGLDSLIRAMSELPADTQLLLVGDGVLRVALESLVAENNLQNRVLFAGAVPADEALRIAAACDVGIALVEPISRSYELALPSKLFEYMMVGLPVVSTRLIQVTELFENETWITFIDKIDPASIASAVTNALNSVTEANRQREKELALVEYHFEHDAVDLLKVIENYLAA
jgi:starch synthase